MICPLKRHRVCVHAVETASLNAASCRRRAPLSVRHALSSFQELVTGAASGGEPALDGSRRALAGQRRGEPVVEEK